MVQDLEKLLSEPLEKRLSDLLDTAISSGWDPSPITLVMRFSKPSFHPFFLRWDLNPVTMRWNFGGGRVALVTPEYSGRLTLRDAALYMQSPEILKGTERSASPWDTKKEGDQ